MKFTLRVIIGFLNVLFVPLVKGDDFVSTSLLSRIAFGSCLNPAQPQLIWDAVAAARPQIFMILDDVLCVGSTNGPDQASAYAELAAQPGYQQLLKTCPVWVLSNSHDNIDQYPGMYNARIFGPTGKQIQFIILDVQTFRGPLQRRTEQFPGEGPWEVNPDKSVPLLGADQWTWLRRRLRVPAQLRIMVSSIQVVAEDHYWEKWMNLPHERKLLFDMISDTEADGVLFISGNRRQAELSMIRDNVSYPLYDLTSGPLNMRAEEPIVEINSRGISEVYRDNNFGLITIDWIAPDPVINLEIRDEKGAVRIQHQITLSVLQAVGHGP